MAAAVSASVRSVRITWCRGNEDAARLGAGTNACSASYLASFFSTALKEAGLTDVVSDFADDDPVVRDAVYEPAAASATLTLRTVAEATSCLALDKIELDGAELRLSRPEGYVPPTASLKTELRRARLLGSTVVAPDADAGPDVGPDADAGRQLLDPVLVQHGALDPVLLQAQKLAAAAAAPPSPPPVGPPSTVTPAPLHRAMERERAAGVKRAADAAAGPMATYVTVDGASFAHGQATFGGFAKPKGQGHMDENVARALYKTTLCKNFMTTGVCHYAGNCNFAHGPEELRMSPRAMGGELVSSVMAAGETTDRAEEERRKMRAMAARSETHARKAEKRKCEFCKRYSCIC